MGGWLRSERALAFGVIASAALHRPLVFWAANAWDLMDPVLPVLIGVAIASTGIVVFLIVTRLTRRDMPAALGLALGIVIVSSSGSLGSVHPLAGLALYVSAVAATSFLSRSHLKTIAVLFVALFGLAPISQVAVAHAQNGDQLPTLPSEPRPSATPTGTVEDVLVVIVDSYPALSVSQSLLGHDTTKLTDGLSELGFTTLDTAWSQHTFTSFALSALLELKPVVAAGSTDNWDHSRNLSKIMGGDNWVADTLQSAGFRYTHIEGGSDSSGCHEVDECMASGLLSEVGWELLSSSAARDWLSRRYGSWMARSTMATHDTLLSLEPVFDDGQHDYVFAHLMLPHEPYVVDETCEVRSQPEELHRRIRAQLACVDSLLLDIAEIVSGDTAVLVTGDHGLKSRSQINKAPGDWDAADIADAFGVLLSFRLPEGCGMPDGDLNTSAMAAIIVCAVDVDVPANRGELLVGLHDYRWITPDQQSEIEASLSTGNLGWIEEEVLSSSVSHEDS